MTTALVKHFIQKSSSGPQRVRILDTIKNLDHKYRAPYRHVVSGVEKEVFVFEHEKFVLKTIVQKRSHNSEPEIYQLAKDSGIQRIFLRSIDPFLIDDELFYFQESSLNYKNAILHSINIDSILYESAQKAQKIFGQCFHSYYNIEYDEFRLFRTAGLPEHIALYYGLEFLDKFCNFCKENKITDLHSNNFFLTKTRKVKIMDYSGVWDEYM